VPDAVVFVGSGATAATLPSVLAVADGVIVGTAVKEGGITTAPVDPERARRFAVAARG
jgi:predicted TIM-barrel enzyme